MNHLLRIIARFCSQMKLELSVEKTVILTRGPLDRSWKVGDTEDFKEEESLVAKCLGINIRLQGRNTIKREKDMVNIARRSAYSILSQKGQDSLGDMCYSSVYVWI